MTFAGYPPIAMLIFRELDGFGDVEVDELPPGIDLNTFAWMREVVRRYRAVLEAMRDTSVYFSARDLP